ncbi:folylpolyglutamate synthase isoform X2 [Amborella trichopoda]|uniref:folylpolyglutamate synthase isoform X2 n=1 Tax=Amborella trichopoda TaxID=13333 RepID=UPI0009C146FB|nr:folylpolyglutamate synthase isoform X2 [Amborella trichopoda]|eukprot:XP_020522269.1 folylpolyglutamate synthase isoform X2 [Amborella trichopoda]
MEQYGGEQFQSYNTCFSSSYEAAMEALSSLISRKRRVRSNNDGKYNDEKLNFILKYLKGSTCTFSEAILRECGFRTGLFTSPHLIDVRERYRINGLDISEDKFLQYFWGCWCKLKENVTEDLPMPPLFQFLTVLAFKIFTSEKVDVAILEVGLGGRLDSTNVVKEPIVCGITSLGMDHMEILGNTLGQIASEKAGIFKPRVPAFTVIQASEAMDVLQKRASELMIPLHVASSLDLNKLGGLKLGLAGDHQLINAGLAVSLCKCWLERTGHSEDFGFTTVNDQSNYLPEAFRRGLSTACLSGRAQIFRYPLVQSCEGNENSSFGDLIFYLDGAHSPESMEVCARWFARAVREDIYLCNDGNVDCSWQNLNNQHEPNNLDKSHKISKQVLLFNCMEVRDPQLLLPQLVRICAAQGVLFSKALLVPSLSTYSKVDSAMSAIPSDVTKDLSWQFRLQKTWERIIHGTDANFEENPKLSDPELLPPSYDFIGEDHPLNCNLRSSNLTSSAVIPSLPVALEWLRKCVKGDPNLRLQVLVTGSLHLVGDVLKLLRRR